ncbi:MAG: hypothetical protein PHC89_01940 [Candidatus Pacebacteria bacterium]|nr:hypothetical protein [Candidatus Paceibacterota bacterium]
MDNLLENNDIIKWCFRGITEKTLADTSNNKILKSFKKEEDNWGNSILGTENNGQWTTRLCEGLAKEALEKIGRKNVRRAENKESSIRNKEYRPDLECDDFVYEVKGRNWTTSGTAGEKILGVPLKYGEVPRLYDKPLQIILVGYQEYEAREAFGFGDLLVTQKQTPELRESLAFYKDKNIEYIGFTDILKRLRLGQEYWNE